MPQKPIQLIQLNASASLKDKGRMIKQLRRRIESIMYERDGEKGQVPLKLLLSGVSRLYGRLQSVRRECYRRGWRRSRKLPCRVVSVGNIVVGGTGKTPMAAYLARAFRQMGLGVVVIKRGYGGRAGGAPRIVGDGRQILLDSERSGDEAQMLARRLMPIPVMIGKDRYLAGLTALRRFKPDVIVLDDGFQHIRLQRDLDLVLLDRTAPLGNGHLLPRGTLREPVDVLRAADGVVLTRSNHLLEDVESHPDFIPPGKPVFRSRHKPHHFLQKRGGPPMLLHSGDSARCCDFSCLPGVRASLFSGIARNERFQRVAVEYGAELVSVHSFCDHHRYTRNELRGIASAARNMGADLLMTTEKDFMRLPADFDWPLDLMVVGVEIDFGGQEAAFRGFLQTRLGL